MSGMWRASDLMQIYPMEFTVTKSRAMTLSKSPQCRAFSWAVMDEKSLSPLFPVSRGRGEAGGGGEGAVLTNDWCIKVTKFFFQCMICTLAISKVSRF